MINAALLHPANRLLHGGTADFAMFGGQPTLGVGIGRAAALDGGYITALRPDAAGAVGNDAAAPLPAVPSSYSPGAGADVPSDGSHASGLAAPPALDPASVTAPQVPAPSGSGSTASSAPLQGPLAQAADAVTSPTHDGSPTIIGAFSAPLVDVGAVAPAVGTTGGLAIAAGLFSGALASAGAVHGELSDVVGGTLAASTATLDTATDGIGYLAGSVADQATTTTGQVEGIATAALDDAQVDVGVVAGIAEGVHDSATAAVLPLVDHLATGADGATDVLAGSDPAGGIATLTGMVGSADIFESPSGVVPGIDSASSALDAVTPETEAASPLLGEDHGLGDLIHGDHDHGIGL